MTFELFLQDPYFQRILLTALVVAATAAALGIHLVLRGLSLFGDGVAHISFAGVALGFALGVLPLASAMVLSCVGALAIQELRRRQLTKGDTAIGVIFTASLALGVVLLSLGAGPGVSLDSYLFGNLLLVGEQDFWIVVAVAVVVLATLALLHRALFALTFDAQGAEVQGLPARGLETVLTLLTAAAIVVASRVVGVLLVSSLLVVPAAAALQWARGFRQAMAIAMALAVAVTVLGLAVSAEFALPSGATIALVSSASFVVALATRR
ncbi:MAG: zinc transport system permease protein [Thermoplasmata archaeon]|jgi:zinc transport system permease protein|nr:zinc transport system permease protein [Thermoplasmata archaeon]